MTESQVADARALRLDRLGLGGARDRLGFRQVLQILLRCMPLLREVRGRLVGLVLAWTLVGAVGLALLAGFLLILWEPILLGRPFSSFQASLLGLDAGQTVGVSELDAETRKQAAYQLLLRSAILTPFLLSGVMAVWYFQVWILQRVNQVLRLRLMDRLQALSLRYHAESRTGDAIYRVYQDSAMVTQLIDVLVLTPLRCTGTYLTGMVFAFLVDPWLALLLAVAWPFTLVVGYWISQRLRVRFRAARETNSALTSRIQESMLGIKVIKAFGLERFEQTRFEQDSRSAFAAAYLGRRLFASLGVSVFWIVSTLTLIGIWRATRLTVEGAPLFGFELTQNLGGGLEQLLVGAGLTTWVLGSYNIYKSMFGQGTGSIERLYRVWGRTQDIAIGIDRVFEVLDLEPDIQDATDAIGLPPFERAIAFEGVSFRYEPERPVLEDIEFEAYPGAITAIVGPTGSGKSTLMALLLRLFDPDAGRILIDGRDLRSFQIASVRERIAIALQENQLFGTTIRENIRYAVPEAPDSAVREAARIACADPFIESLPEGYDTLLGERGSKLSSGQRQRLSIARAVLKDTSILILDEPTASLDAETELSLLRNLADWGKGRAIFLITHRLSTIQRADLILYLEGGRLRERGTHAELMGSPDGAYRALVENESLSSEPPEAREAAGENLS
ncbi:MAG: ABC transporter ATP-binding protein [Myxococcota bacterium]|nr:ABC transporter ATP-binding protein [Myxococcota bacterium]